MKRFCFVFGIGLAFAGGLTYGGYPPTKTIARRLSGGRQDAGANFRKTFYDVRQCVKNAGRFGFCDPRILIGERGGHLEQPEDPEKWLYSQTGGSFHVLVDGTCIFRGDVIDRLVRESKFREHFRPSETDEKALPCAEGEESTVCPEEETTVDSSIAGLKEDITEKRFASIRELLKTLTSRIFMECLLGEDTVEAFLENGKHYETSVRISLSPDPQRPFQRTSVFMEYVQVEKLTVVYPLRVMFRAVWNAEADRFVDDKVCLLSFWANNRQVYSKKFSLAVGSVSRKSKK